MVLRAPREFIGDKDTHFVKSAVLDVIELGPPDASGRRSPVVTGKTEEMAVDLAIMALGNTPNPIVKDAEPDLKTTKWGTIEVKQGSQETSIDGVFSGGDAARGGSARTSPSSTAARSRRCRRASRNCTTRWRRASRSRSCAHRASSSATAGPTSSRTPCST
jgi:NADPH-dependent glutamate synthase beta subunit-like oxidoreductase